MKVDDRFRWLIGVSGIVLVCAGHAASWHIDATATGLNTGKDWANAWTNFSSITWASVLPGDDVYLSKGTYPEVLAIKKSGTSNAPITLRVSPDAPHNGRVIIPGMNLGFHQWITIDGSISASFPAPANIGELGSIDDNIGIFCVSTNGTAIYMTAPVGIKLHWLGVARAQRGAAREAHGIYANVTRRGPTDHNQVRYCWIKDVDDDGIAWIGNAPSTHFGHQEISFSIIELVGDDGLEANSGFTVHDCVIGPSRFKHGHPDGIQSQGSFWRVYNNEFQDFLNSWIRAQAVDTLHHDVWIYNNLFLSGKRTNGVAPLSNTGIEVVQYAAFIGEQPGMTWSNIIIANNTFFNAVKIPGQAINWAKRDERTPGAFVHNVIVTNSMVVNNLFVDCANGASANWQSIQKAPPWGRGVHYSTEQSLIWDYNIATGGRAKKAARVGYFGKEYSTGEAMARQSVWKNNSSKSIKFVDIVRWDLRIAPGDTAARRSGTNLSSIFGYDLLNRARPSSGGWSRGALQAD
jgi:hypothetical protein